MSSIFGFVTIHTMKLVKMSFDVAKNQKLESLSYLFVSLTTYVLCFCLQTVASQRHVNECSQVDAENWF